MPFIFILALFIFGNEPSLLVQCTAFANNNFIPKKFTCDGENFNPALTIGNIPKNAKSLALIMDDVESPNGEFDHWVMWNIPVKNKIPEHSAPGVQGQNSRKENKYYGPCPPNGIHKYHFRIYALDSKLDMPETSGKADLLKAMQGHVLASGEVVGQYKSQRE